VASDDRVTPRVGAGSVSHDCHGAGLEGVGQTAASSDVGPSPASDHAARPGKVAVASCRHGDVACVAIGGNVGESEHSNVVGVATVRRVIWVADEAGEAAQGAGAAVGHGSVRRSRQDTVGSNGSASAVGGRDGLDPADERRPARVAVADTERHLVGMVGNVRIGSPDHTRVNGLAERRCGQTEQNEELHVVG